MRTKKQMAADNTPSGFPHGFEGSLSREYWDEKLTGEWWVAPMAVLLVLATIGCFIGLGILLSDLLGL